MRGNDGPADRKAQPHSLRFSSEERLEDAFHCSLRNAAAAVRDRHNHCATTILDSSTNEQPAVRSLAIGHRVISIDYQVDQHLLKLHRVARDGRQIPSEFSVHGYALIYEIAADQLQDIAYDFVYMETLLLYFTFFQPQAQPTDHFCGVLVFAYNVIKNFAYLGEV